MKVPIRHHYIPQFLIRPFCRQADVLIYYDKKINSISEKKPEDVFMVRNLYRDSINNATNPVQIENDLARFEGEASRIIKKLREDDTIILSIEEEEKLRLFFAVMGFRSRRTSEAFGDKATIESEDFYSFYQEDGNLTDFWKRNLGELVKCRSIDDVLKNTTIDDPIKLFMRRDVVGLLGIYTMVVERRGEDDFILGDCYPLVVEGSADNGLKVVLYHVFPISPQRAVLLVANGAEYAPSVATGFDKGFFKKPILQRDRKNISVQVKKIYGPEVRSINQMILDNSTEGLILKDEQQVNNYNL